jgi:hypothetical protein
MTSALTPSLSLVMKDRNEASKSVSCSPERPTEWAVRLSLSSRVSTTGPLSLRGVEFGRYAPGDVSEAATEALRWLGDVVCAIRGVARESDSIPGEVSEGIVR